MKLRGIPALVAIALMWLGAAPPPLMAREPAPPDLAPPVLADLLRAPAAVEPMFCRADLGGGPRAC
jgi:hypothetical protein